MPKKDINRASKNSLAKFPPATKYPEKNEPTAPTVKTNAAVLNKCNRLSGKMPLSGGKNAFLNLSIRIPDFLKVLNRNTVGKIKKTIANFGICIDAQIPGKTSVADPAKNENIMDNNKNVTGRLRRLRGSIFCHQRISNIKALTE